MVPLPKVRNAGVGEGAIVGMGLGVTVLMGLKMASGMELVQAWRLRLLAY